MPARPADAGNRKRLRRQDAYAPARDGSRRAPELAGLGRTAPAPDDEAERTGGFGRQLKAPRRDHRQARRLGDDGAKPAEAQGLLAGFKHIVFADCLDIDDPVRMQTGLRQRRSKKVRSRQTPDDDAARAGSDAGGKKRGCSPIDGAGPTAGNFMDCTIGKSATW